MLKTPLVGDEVKAVLVVTALVLLGVTAFIVHTRGEWLALRHRLFKRLEAAEGVSHPSRVAGGSCRPAGMRRSARRWNARFATSTPRATQPRRRSSAPLPIETNRSGKWPGRSRSGP